jgi:hypothetical protein
MAAGGDERPTAKLSYRHKGGRGRDGTVAIGRAPN